MSTERHWNRNKVSRESPDKEVNHIIIIIIIIIIITHVLIMVTLSGKLRSLHIVNSFNRT